MEDQDRIRIEEYLPDPLGDNQTEVVVWNAVRAALNGSLVTSQANARLLPEAKAALADEDMVKGMREVFRRGLKSLVPVLGYIRFDLGEANQAARESARKLRSTLCDALGMEVAMGR